MSDSRRNPKNPWNQNPGGGRKGIKNKNQRGNSQQQQAEPPKNDATAKFLEAQSRLQKAVEKHVNYEGDLSSEEEDDLETQTILESLLKNYSQFGGKSEDLGRTQNYLENAFHSGAAVCLICIGSVKRTEAIWSCDSCYGFFHLTCIQRWGKDSIAHQKISLELRGEKIPSNLAWQCPKCRKDYEPKSIPSRYECFCGQTINPQFHPWLVPHSCGEPCGKPLLPECGHLCLLLCHPGPCPPCPKTIRKACYCKSGGEKPVRCSQKDWSCGDTCGSELGCGKHVCSEPCHPPPCPQCKQQSLLSCNCGSQTKLTNCAQLFWQCEKVCDKRLECGDHRCERVCHRDKCGPCPRSEPRCCPCGKEVAILPCTQEVSTCGGTCAKLLDCGLHTCSERCHRGSCGMCLEISMKQCKCGLHKKEVSCHKEYLCETKCKRMRDCNIHPCNRKCCNGTCPPCEKMCGKTLSCGQHKCNSVCHSGACYPCNLTKNVSCRCGSTVITVPCAAKRRHPPKCNKLCREVPECHHRKREPHKCHFGQCPPCRQPCAKGRDCGHPCTQPCHSAVLVNVQPDYKPATPWEKMIAPVEVRALPCPPCPVPVAVVCPGGHEEIMLPCHRAVSQSCGKPCGRALSCANHTCQLSCHQVIGAPNNKAAGENCEVCMSECLFERECEHSCELACHPPPCPPCQVSCKFKCHCSLIQKFIKCTPWLQASEEERDQLLSCGNQCPKSYECGHRCTRVCHSGDCPGSSSCKKKMKMSCPCKRIKKEIQCQLVTKGQGNITCDDDCRSLQLLKKQEEEKGKKETNWLEEKRNQEELEMYEKKMQGRRRQRKRQYTNDEDTPGFYSRHRYTIWGLSGLFLALAGYLFTLR